MTHEQRTAPSNPAALLADAFWALKQKRIRCGTVGSTRASSIGHECERFLYYERTSNHLRALHEPSLQAIFDLGNHLEKFVLREIEDMGFQVVEAQRDYSDSRYQITGHIDAKIVVPGYPRALPCEVKGLSPFTVDSINTIADIRDNKAPHVRRYYAQLQTYLVLDAVDLGLFALLSKTSGQIKFIECPLDFAFAETLLQKAERIKVAVGLNAPPAKNLEANCAECAFAHVCCPDLQFGQAPEVLSDPELEQMLAKREQLKTAASEFKALDEEIKAKVGERPLALCGDYSITGKTVQRKSYTVAAGSYWQQSIKRITKALNGASNGNG